MARSALLDLGKPTYPFAPTQLTGIGWDPDTENDVENRSSPPEGTWRIFASETSNRQPGDEPGLDRRQVRLDCRIVQTPTGKPLRMPEGVGEGFEFPLTVRGKTGTATIEATANSQLEDVQAELGETFTVVWRSV